MVKIWPEIFENKDFLTKEEKELLRRAGEMFKEGNLIVNIDPLGTTTDKMKFGMMIYSSKGLITFSIIREPFNIDNINSYLYLRESIENKIEALLLDSKALIVSDGVKKKLAFPYRHIILFQQSKPMSIGPLTLGGDLYDSAVKYLYTKYFSCVDDSKKSYIFNDFDKEYDSEFSEITETQKIAIFSKLAPEYVIFMNEKDTTKVAKTKDTFTEDALKITGKENELKTFLLDTEQVNIVNEMGTGQRVILANPGAGKSVILLSKAFKYASIYKDEKILITCFNYNLADSYKFKIAQTRFANKSNIEIKTLHGIVRDLYEKMGKRISGDYATPEEIADCIKWLRMGLIELKYKAVFVDEVQIFEPEFLDLCYEICDIEDENATFTLTGDLNQNVRMQSKRGDATWKRMSKKLDFTGRVKYIEKNYRNTIQIGGYIKNMLDIINDQLDKYHILQDKEFEYEFDEGLKDGKDVIIKRNLSRDNIAVQIVDELEKIVKENELSYSDVAILYPYSSHKSVNYYISLWLDNELSARNINHSFIAGSNKALKKSFSRATGVVLSTIESSLGLDFKAVIVCGLYPYNYVYTNYKKYVGKWTDLKELTEEEKISYSKNLRQIYTACSRAREILCVMSDADANTPIDKLIKG